MRPRHATALFARSSLRVPAQHQDEYPAVRKPAVWLIEPDVPVLIAGRLYLEKHPTQDPVECRILDVATLEEANDLVATHHGGRPSIRALRRLARRLAGLPDPSPDERAFVAAIEYVTTGLVKGWPGRIASLDGKLPHQSR